MRKWIISAAIVVLLAVVCVLVFIERPLIPEGYTIERVGTGIHDIDRLNPVDITLEPGRTFIQYNSRYPSWSTVEYMAIDTDELEAILKTARCRTSVSNYGNIRLAEVKYQFHITLINGNKIRHVMLYLGENCWDEGRRIHYDIQNGAEIIAALDTSQSLARIN